MDMSNGWRFLTGDVNWEDYGGMWYKQVNRMGSTAEEYERGDLTFVRKMMGL